MNFLLRRRLARWHRQPARPGRLGVTALRVPAVTSPAAAVAVVTVTPWSVPVEFLPGDEWIVTITGPDADAPKVRITMKFRTRTYPDG